MSAPSPSSLPADDLEPVPFCEACDAPAESARFLFRKEGLAVRRCARCGLVYVAPRLSRDALWRRYGDEYFRDEYIPQHGPFSDESNDERFAACLRDLDRLRPARGRLHEFGAATGLFLRAAQRDGWEVSGIDLSEYAAAHARREFGLEVVAGEAEDAALPPGAFDAVAMWDTIEHLRYPRKAVSAAYSALKPGGILALSTPNIAGLTYRLLGGRWWVVGPREHIFYFSRGTLARLVESVGFRVVYARTVGFDVRYVVNALIGKPAVPAHVRNPAGRPPPNSQNLYAEADGPAPVARRETPRSRNPMRSLLRTALKAGQTGLGLSDALFFYAQK